MPTTSSAHEPHPWAEKTPDEVLEALVYELYAPVSALGDEIDRLATGAFEDDDLPTLLGQLREGVNHLSRLVVSLKRYTADRRAAPAAPEP
ncbi:MAG TPA: hypothetical protein VF897_11240 [Roseiflexaceae bacterium]